VTLEGHPLKVFVEINSKLMIEDSTKIVAQFGSS